MRLAFKLHIFTVLKRFHRNVANLAQDLEFQFDNITSENKILKTFNDYTDDEFSPHNREERAKKRNSWAHGSLTPFMEPNKVFIPLFMAYLDPYQNTKQEVHR